MSDTSLIPPEDLDDHGNPRTVAMKRTDIRALEKQAKRAADLEAELADLRRERAFMAAGVPVDDPAAKYFVKGYDGDLDPQAIKAAAVEARILQGQQVTDEEKRQHEAAQAAAAGGTPPGTGPDLGAQLAELGKKTFAPSDDVARQAHITEIARVVREGGARIPLNG